MMIANTVLDQAANQILMIMGAVAFIGFLVLLVQIFLFKRRKKK